MTQVCDCEAAHGEPVDPAEALVADLLCQGDYREIETVKVTEGRL